MLQLFQKSIFPVLMWSVFVYVILHVPYPESLTQATALQFFLFFIPLLLAFSFTFNSILKNIFVSSSISLGLVILLILKALDSLNMVTGALTIISIYLLVSYFKKMGKPSLTKGLKIPKLTRLGRGENQK